MDLVFRHMDSSLILGSLSLLSSLSTGLDFFGSSSSSASKSDKGTSTYGRSRFTSLVSILWIFQLPHITVDLA
ncbi:hypothetical protein CRG98_003202 [Punica granatum]|uniref:Uncharacterized protein n=1 Tax=Punica granatum TaxID=22663 RepID=A0A2I0L6S8_PUNGR|nr:hypothetical protein CRG98_003202 [Punica granatum]